MSHRVHGVALGANGGAIASASYDGDRVHVTDFGTFPAQLPALARAIQELLAADPNAMVRLDAGLHGLDLWEYLGGRPRRRMRLWQSPKPELRRAELAGKLRARSAAQAFTIRGDLRADPSLRKAITDATREDAAERPEIVALALAVSDRRRQARIW
jgi:hypothetical protein